MSDNKGKIPKTGMKADPAKTEEAVGRMETKTLPQVAVETVKRVLGLRDMHAIPCPMCSTPEEPVLTKAGSTGPVVTYYYCRNRESRGCRFSHQVPRTGLLENMRKKMQGEQVKNPIKDGGNYGGLPPIE